MRPRLATLDDAAEIARIYNHAIDHTVASFWTEPKSPDDMASWMAAHGPGYPWVVMDAGRSDAARAWSSGMDAGLGSTAGPRPLAGVAWTLPWNPRGAYAGTAETSVYVCPDRQGRGVGRAIYLDLFDRLDAIGYRHAIAGITLPNEASVRLHESVGFEHTGTFRGIGVKFGRALDVGYWQRVCPRLADPHDLEDGAGAG